MADGKVVIDTELDEKGFNSAASRMGKHAKTAFKAAGIGVAALATAVVGVSAAFVSGVKDVAAYGDAVDKNSQRIGLSKEAYQEWGFVLSQSGVDINSMQTGLKTLTNTVDDAKNGSAEAVEKFERLGLSMEQVGNMSREEIFENTIAGLQGITDETEKAALANDLFGKSGQDMIPLLNQSAEATDELRKKAIDYGFVMSDEAVAASAAFTDSLDVLGRTTEGLKNKMAGEFLPAITQVTDGLALLMTGDMSGLEMINEGIEEFIDKVAEVLPAILEIGGNIVFSLANAIIDNLPVLLESGVALVLNLVDGIIANLPMIIDVGLQMLVTLAMGIAQSLPTLLPTLVDTVIAIVDGLIDNIDLLIDAAIAIIVALAEGLIESLPKLVEKAPVIVAKLVAAIIRNVPKLVAAAVEIIATLAKGIIEHIGTLLEAAGELVNQLLETLGNGFKAMYDVGANIVTGIWNGIKSGWTWLTDKVASLAKGLVDAAKGALGIASPSKEFAKVGLFSAQGIGVGFEKEMPKIKKQMQDSLIDLTADAQATISMEQGKLSGSSSRGIRSVTESITSSTQVVVHKIDLGLKGGLEQLAEVLHDPLQDVDIIQGGVY